MTVPHKQEGRGLPGFSQQDKGVIRHIPQLRMMVLDGVSLSTTAWSGGVMPKEGGKAGPFQYSGNSMLLAATCQ